MTIAPHPSAFRPQLSLRLAVNGELEWENWDGMWLPVHSIGALTRTLSARGSRSATSASLGTNAEPTSAQHAHLFHKSPSRGCQWCVTAHLPQVTQFLGEDLGIV